MKEIHNTPYAMHPRYQKTIAIVKRKYLWRGMKKYISEYLAMFMECQRVKVEYRHPSILFQRMPIPEWKWDAMSIEFITKFPKTRKKHNFIMVVVDMLTKFSHFVLVK